MKTHFIVRGPLSIALFWIYTGPKEGSLPGVNVVLAFTGQVQGLEVLEDVPALRVVDGKHVPPGHEATLQVSQFQPVQGQHVLLVFLLEAHQTQ